MELKQNEFEELAIGSDNLSDYIASSEEAPLFQNPVLSIDEHISLEKLNNESNRIKTILSIWEKQQSAERDLRNKYASWFIGLLVAQLIAINIIFVLIGCKILSFEQWTANLFIVSVFGEIVGIVSIIVKYLFTSTNKEMIELIKDQK